MTIAQTDVRESLYRRILDLSDEEIGLLERYVSDIEEHEPNEETIAAFREAANIENLTTCSDLQDMLIQCGIKR